MPEGCRVCQAWHDAGGATEECGHWCHYAGAEDWEDGEPGE